MLIIFTLNRLRFQSNWVCVSEHESTILLSSLKTILGKPIAESVGLVRLLKVEICLIIAAMEKQGLVSVKIQQETREL